MNFLLSRVLFLVIFVLFCGCEIRQAGGGDIGVEESIADRDVNANNSDFSAAPQDANAASDRGIIGTFLDGIGIQVSQTEEQAPIEPINPLDYDAQLYAEKKVVANELIGNQENHAEICRGTRFGEVFNFDNTMVLAYETTQRSYDEEKQRWQEALNLQNEPIAIPVPDSGDNFPEPREIQADFSIQENFAHFRVTTIPSTNFQNIQLNSLEDRTASLMINAIGVVTPSNLNAEPLRAETIQLTYLLSKDRDNSWRCAHVHASYNPNKKNSKMEDELGRCDSRKGWTKRATQRKIAACKEEVYLKYEYPGRIGEPSSNTPRQSTPRSRSW